MELSHINKRGEASMVDVSDKEITLRKAGAAAIIVAEKSTIDIIAAGVSKKGDILAAARIAGINAAKKTSELIPLCHIIPLEKVEINFAVISDIELVITSYVKCTYKTGVEMEALTAASCAALTIYDMCKAIDKRIAVKDIHLTRKSGGKSGNFTDLNVNNLFVKENRGKAAINTQRLRLIESYGVEGDVFADGGDRQISLISKKAYDKLLTNDNSVCSKRFSPNIVFNGTNPKVGDKLRIGTATIEITQVGRDCHNICEHSQQNDYCLLVYNVIFAKVTESGDMEIHDEMIYV